MEVITYSAALARFTRRYEPSAQVADTVAALVRAVRERGDEALLECAVRFEGVNFPSAAELRVGDDEFAEAETHLLPEDRSAIRASLENVRDFAARSRRQDWSAHNAQGAEVGEVFQPFDRVGIYVPGGSAPLVSTVNMTVGIAKAAGCQEVVVCSPPGAGGRMHPAMLHALREAGADEVYKVGGAQAIAAMAYGTDTIRAVRKIFGPGNAYVMEAKRQVFGAAAIDLLPGPSEVLVIADRTGTPSWIAADLLAQAEHGGDSVAVLVSDSPRILESVREELDRQAPLLSRQGPLRTALDKNCVFVLVGSMEEAVEVANAFAPEHLALFCEREAEMIPQIRSAGAIFAGGFSPVAVGDFLAGPSHELPTGGACQGFSGLTVDQFQRRTSLIRISREALARSLPYVESFARMEGLDAHGRSVAIRLEQPS